MKIAAMVLAVAALGACRPSAMKVCKQLETAGAAENCAESKPTGIGSAAKERVTFDVTNEDKPRTGQVLTFEDEGALNVTAEKFEKLEKLAGPNVFVSKGSRVLVQVNKDVLNAKATLIQAEVQKLGE